MIDRRKLIQIINKKMVSFFMKDEFTTNQSAPLGTSRTCQPGPGTLTISDTSNRLSISGGAIINSGNIASGNPLSYFGTFNRGVGIAGWWRFKINSGTGRVMLNGFSNVVGAPIIHTLTFPDFTVYDNTVNPVTGESTAVIGTTYDMVLVLQSTGAYYFIKGGVFTDWTIVWVSVSNNTASLYQVFSAGGSVGSTWELQYFSNFLLKSIFQNTYGLATYYNSTPTNGTISTIDADGFITFSWTPASSEIMEIMIRRTDDNNCWIIRCSQTGSTIKIIQKQAGVETERASAAVTFTVGTPVSISVKFFGAIIRTYTNSATRNNYTAATFNQTATGLKVSGFLTGANLGAFPRTAPSAAISEINKYTGV